MERETLLTGETARWRSFAAWHLPEARYRLLAGDLVAGGAMIMPVGRVVGPA